MPTSRALTFLSAALVLYLFANQTQVGWLYVMSALLGGTVLAAWFLNRGILKTISAERKIGQVEMHEGDTVSVALALHKGQGSTSQIRLEEKCPLAAPDSPQKAVKLFIPSLPANGSVEFDYEVLVDRRGLHEFPPLALNSRAPFGFFKRAAVVQAPTRVLVYPEVRPLKRLELLDKQAAPEVTRQRAGIGYEVIGVRPFRSGDSARHIHWRSVARTGQLMSKEFADEAQPGLTLVLDLFQHPYPQSDTKHIPFEWMVKIAASIADYARVKGYPLHILADSEVLPIPSGPVAWSALLQYLARIQPTGKRRLPEVFGSHSTQAFIAAVLPWPDSAALETLNNLQHKRADVLAVVLDPDSFPAGGLSAHSFASSLRAGGTDTRLIRFGDDWTTQLGARAESGVGLS
ncbi:MAG: DUF58 domain-containing protein [Chloroflexota bacterium]